MNSADVVADRVIEMPHVRGGHCDVLGEAAVAIDADDLRERTHVRVTRAAQQTSTVYDVTLGGDAIAFLNIGDESSDLDYVAGEFMSDDEWRLAAAAGPLIPVVDVNVGAADSGAANFDQNFIVADFRLGYIAQDHSRACGFFYESFQVSEVERYAAG
jgi:hypothetical protein